MEPKESLMNLRDDGRRSGIGLTTAKAQYEYLPNAGRGGSANGIGGKCGPDPTSRKLEAFRTLLSSTERNGHETRARLSDVRPKVGMRRVKLFHIQNLGLCQMLARWTAKAFSTFRESQPLVGVLMSDHHVFGIAIPIKPYERLKPIRDRKYLAFVRSLPCLVCCSIKRVEAAHFGPHGLGQKASDLSAIPLCRIHHRKGPHSIHALGPVRFQEVHKLDILAMIEKLNQFYNRTRKKAA